MECFPIAMATDARPVPASPPLPSPESARSRTLGLAVAPSGHPYLEPEAGASDLTAAAAARITRAFARGDCHGLLHLGAVEVATALPASLAFGRELAQHFMTRLCAVVDLSSQWDRIDVPAPGAVLAHLAESVPPMRGAEYLNLTRLEMLWNGLLATARSQIAAEGGNLQAWLQRQHASWNLVGRVCFHLAENKNSVETPFAFLATYVPGLSLQSRVQHQPLGRALQAYAGANDRDALLALLLPVHKAAAQSPWLQALVDSGKIFQPNAWTPAQAHQFLQTTALIEACGIVVRIPDWWHRRQPPRPQVRVNIGARAAGLGLQTLLDFDVALTLDDEVLSAGDWAQLMAAGDSLVQLRGRWIEVDREKLDGVLAHWEKVQRASADDGITFLEGMRLLAGASVDDAATTALPPATADWSTVVAGDWLAKVLDDLRHPHGGGEAVDPGDALKAQLRPYQQDGVQWLWWLNRLGLGGCLADDMGLGKTVQIIALLLLAKREADPGPHLLVLPASLMRNWQAEIERFAPSLRTLVAHPSMPQADKPLDRIDVVITSYGSLLRLPWLLATQWSVVVLDEAQAIKNPGARQTQAAKALKSRVRFALTGTPVENRLGDLWSIFDFICPGLLGSDQAFRRFARRLEADEHVDYAPLRKLVQPYILRRMKTDRRIIADLPDKTELKAYCTLSRLQASLYAQAVDALAEQIATLDGIARRGAVLAFLMRLKQVCNHPSQWLGDGGYAPDDSGKFARLRELAEAIDARQEKMLVFTQFKEMTAPLAAFLEGVFGRAGLVLHGGTPVKMRQGLVDRFQEELGPPFFVLSIKAGGTGLNLTAAAHVVHFDRWWNPAVENQATDRAYRIGQRKNVLVHKFICRGTVEEKIDALIEAKQGLSDSLLAGGGEIKLTEMSNEALLQMVRLDLNSAMDER